MILSIIIISYNTNDVLVECLDSIYQNYKEEFDMDQFETIVVDNASTDNTKETIRKNYTWVKLISNNDNLGFSSANNIGVKFAKGKFILFLNPDTFIPESTISYLLEYMGNNPNVAIVTCKVLLTNGELDDASHRGFPTPWRALTYFIGLSKFFPRSNFFNGYHLGYQNLDKIHEIDACAGAFLLIRTSIGNEVGWFDEEYFWYGEDLDLCYRVKQKAYKIMFVPQVTITHIKGAASGIKKHSQHLSHLDNKTQNKIIESRFNVMRIFYRKHYAKKYPFWITFLVLFGIWVKQKITQTNL